MKPNKKLVVLFAAVASIALMGASECDTGESNRKDVATVNEQQGVYATNQPVPRFSFSQDRDTLIQIYTLKNEARNTFSVFQSNGTGEQRFTCPSVGYAIPADASLTNPLRGESTGATVELAEPNGLFASKNTDGTWVLCVRQNGEVVPVYTELKVTTFPFAVRWENGQYVEVVESASTAKVTVRRK